MTEEDKLFQDIPPTIIKQSEISVEHGARELCIKIPVRKLSELYGRVRQLETALKKAKQRRKR